MSAEYTKPSGGGGEYFRSSRDGATESSLTSKGDNETGGSIMMT